MFFTYPAVFSKTEKFYNIEFPDFPEIKVSSSSSGEAATLANQTLESYIIYLMLGKKEIPKASPIEKIISSNSDNNVILVSVCIPEITGKYIRKTLTIPEWLNSLAIKHNLNFSQILTNALIEKIGIMLVSEKMNDDGK